MEGYDNIKTKADIKRRRKTLIDSGCSRPIFTNHLLFKYFHKCMIASDRGEEICVTGIGTVCKHKGCLNVPNMNVNLFPVMHVLDDIPNVSITFEKPDSRGVCIIRHRLQQFQEVTFKHQNRLFEVSDFKWFGVEELEEEVLLEQYQMKASKVRANYVVGVAIQGIEEEIVMLANVMGSDWLTDERFRAYSPGILNKG